MEPTVDPAMLPLPSALQNGNAAAGNDANEYPVEFLSVLFNQHEQNEVLRISKKAITPMWLTRNMYKKLPADVKYELPPIDTEDLQRRYAAFEQKIKPNETTSAQESSRLQQLGLKASQMYTNAFQQGCTDAKELLKH